MFEYEIQRCARRCAATDRELSPGEQVYSVLRQQGAELVRHDYCQQGWEGPPQDAVAWWQWQLPVSEGKKPGWAPHEVMLDLFQRLAEQPDQHDLRYVLALLLVRRRIMRLEQVRVLDHGGEVLVLSSHQDDVEYQVPVSSPSEARVTEIQQQIATLLFK